MMEFVERILSLYERLVAFFHSDMSALTVPYIFEVLAVIAIILLIFRRWKLAIPFAIAAIFVNIASETFPMHFSHFFQQEKENGDLRIMTFNIHSNDSCFDSCYQDIADVIIKSGSDIVLLNEALESRENSNRFDSLLMSHFLYSTKDSFSSKSNVFYSMVPVTSFQILQTTELNYFPFAKFSINGQEISFLGCHLNSNNYLEDKTRLEVDSIRTRAEAKEYKGAVQVGYSKRRLEVDSICRFLPKNCDLQNLVILGDMNDICGSYTLRTLESLGLKDAWWNKGFGIGCTRDVRFLHFRLDHILVGNNFEIKDVKVPDTGELSDHEPVVVTLRQK